MNRHPEWPFLLLRRSASGCTPPVIRCAMVAVLLMTTAFSTPSRAATLVEKGRGRAIIILPEKPSPVAEGAARVLRDHIRQMSGAELPLRTEDRLGPRSPSRHFRETRWLKSTALQHCVRNNREEQL